jgi:essential nuclear protein 1
MKTLDALLPANSGERRTLADIIFAKLDSSEVGDAAVVRRVSQIDHERPDPALGLNPKVVEVYTKCVFIYIISCTGT